MKFIEGQRAWSVRHGWGTIIRIVKLSIYSIEFVADNDARVWVFTIDGKNYTSDVYPTLFHKEQVLDYSEPEIPKGTLCFFWDEDNFCTATIGKYNSARTDGKGHFMVGGKQSFDFVSIYPKLPRFLQDKSK